MQNYMVMFEHKKQNEKRAAKSEESNLTKSQTERKENGYWTEYIENNSETNIYEHSSFLLSNSKSNASTW